jgi:hypothetical protein
VDYVALAGELFQGLPSEDEEGQEDEYAPPAALKVPHGNETKKKKMEEKDIMSSSSSFDAVSEDDENGDDDEDDDDDDSDEEENHNDEKRGRQNHHVQDEKGNKRKKVPLRRVLRRPKGKVTILPISLNDDTDDEHHEEDENDKSRPHKRAQRPRRCTRSAPIVDDDTKEDETGQEKHGVDTKRMVHRVNDTNRRKKSIDARRHDKNEKGKRMVTS